MGSRGSSERIQLVGAGCTVCVWMLAVEVVEVFVIGEEIDMAQGAAITLSYGLRNRVEAE